MIVLRVFRCQMKPVESLHAHMYMHKDKMDSYNETAIFGFLIYM